MNDTNNNQQVNNAQSPQTIVPGVITVPSNNIAQQQIQNITSVEKSHEIEQKQSANNIESILQNENNEVKSHVDNSMIVSATMNNNYEPGTYSSTLKKRVVEEENDEPQEEVGVYKFPIGIIIGFIAFIIAFLIYYLVIMTPTKAFDGTIYDIFNGVFDFIEDLNKSQGENPTLNVDFSADIITKNINDKGYNIEKYNGKQMGISLDLDFGKGNYGFKLFTTNNGKEKLKDGTYAKAGTEEVNTGFYLNNNKLYLAETSYNGQKITEYPIEFESSSKGVKTLAAFNYEKLSEVKDVVMTSVDEILERVDSKNLSRSIVVKKIQGESAIALKSTCEIDEEIVRSIYKSIFQEYITREDILDDFVTLVPGSTKESVAAALTKIYERDVNTKYIYVNLYTNLIDTEVLGIEVIVNRYYVNIEMLNDIFDITYSRFDEIISDEDIGNVSPVFTVNLKYNPHKKTLSGNGSYYSPNVTNLKGEFTYTRENDLRENNGFESKLNISFSHGNDEAFSIFKNVVKGYSGLNQEALTNSVTASQVKQMYMAANGCTEEQFIEEMSEQLDEILVPIKEYATAIIHEVAGSELKKSIFDKTLDSLSINDGGETIGEMISGKSFAEKIFGKSN